MIIREHIFLSITAIIDLEFIRDRYCQQLPASMQNKSYTTLDAADYPPRQAIPVTATIEYWGPRTTTDTQISGCTNTTRLNDSGMYIILYNVSADPTDSIPTIRSRNHSDKTCCNKVKYVPCLNKYYVYGTKDLHYSINLVFGLKLLVSGGLRTTSPVAPKPVFAKKKQTKNKKTNKHEKGARRLVSA